jgi:hypothetical protein
MSRAGVRDASIATAARGRSSLHGRQRACFGVLPKSKPSVLEDGFGNRARIEGQGFVRQNLGARTGMVACVDQRPSAFENMTCAIGSRCARSDSRHMARMICTRRLASSNAQARPPRVGDSRNEMTVQRENPFGETETGHIIRLKFNPRVRRAGSSPEPCVAFPGFSGGVSCVVHARSFIGVYRYRFRTGDFPRECGPEL